jgi:hypothetical protein
MRFIKYDISYVALIAGFSLSALYAMELGRELRQLDKPNQTKRVLGLLFEIPQLILGLLSILLGCCFMWFGCNRLFKESLEHGAVFSDLGFGAVLIYVGAR